MAPLSHNGPAIRKIRELSGLTIDDLAQRVSISTPHMRNIENELKGASPAVLAKIAQSLDTPIAAIMRTRGDS